MEPCTQKDTIERIVKLLDGNGKKGLRDTVISIETKVDGLTADIQLLTSSVADLINFRSEYAGVEKYKEKEGLTARQKAGLYISATIGISSIITALIIKFA